jgi:hypothetical protein
MRMKVTKQVQGTKMRNLLLSILFLGLAACGSDDPYGGGGGGGGTVGQATQLTVSTSVQSIPSDGTAPATITAFARDASNNLVANVPVTFTATSGGISSSSGSTNTSGEATATLSTAGDPTVRTITVTATSGSLTATVNVQVAAGGSGGEPVVVMGSGTGANFQAGTLGINTPNLSAGGSTSVQVVLQQSDGVLYAQDVSISFTSACVAQGLATITNPVETSAGIASANYVATGCAGADVITATTTVGGQQLSANGTITVAAGVIGSIIFESATPSNVALRGTGNSNNPETSMVVFRVLDQAGGPRVGTTVNFALNTTVGGITFSPASAVSGVDGRVQTVVQGGTVATTVRVTATVQGVTPVLATQSSQLTVTTGIPDQDSFSLAVQCPNVEAWNLDGVEVPVTARLSDRFNNPVPDGTAVTFQTEGGSIVSQCQTTGGIGRCTVDWTSSNPRASGHPNGETRAGRSSLLATAIGEESFTDTNGNGSFDNLEVKQDLPERFLDENEDGLRDPTEPIYDFNNNSTYDPADGFFNGVLCNNTTECSTQTTTGISARGLIIMSGNSPTWTASPAGPITVARGSNVTIDFLLEDLNGNPMPGGTSVNFSANGTGLSVGTPSSFSVACTTEPTNHPVTIIANPTATSGTLVLSTTTPSGVTFVSSRPVTVTP